jgi:hypothetical protein
MDEERAADGSPLEAFVRDYLETLGGAWDEVEPQVYDVLLPPEGSSEGGVLRLTFDPEALPEHPGSQLASFGTPLVDRLLADSMRRGRSARFYLLGLNLNPHNLAGKLRKALTLGSGLELALGRVRALHFTQAVYWFRAEFISDQREQTLLPMGIDLHYLREVRHLEQLIDPARLAEKPAQPLPEARRAGLGAGYETAREHALPTLAALANVRGRELAERRERQIERMSRYYADLRGELDEQLQRSRKAEEAAARRDERRAAIDREEQVRIAELRQKSTLRAEIRLLQVLQVEQPKLLAHVRLESEKHPPSPLEVVYDPLTEAVEAPACPVCGRPTFALELNRLGQVTCPACASPGRGSPRSGGHR